MGALFDDWENGAEEFPALFDLPSPDPSDPLAPTSTLTPSGAVYANGGTTYLGKDHQLTLAAQDAVFTAGQLGLRYRVYKGGTTPTEDQWQTLANGGSFALPLNGGDGLWHVDYQAQDPCHTFAVEPNGSGGDALTPETLRTATFFLDTTPPTITYTSPADGQEFDTDDFSAIGYTVADDGAGVANHSVAFDGQPAQNGDVLDMFFLMPGKHTLVVTAADNVNNTATKPLVFEVHATRESLLSNVDRAWQLRLITDEKVYKGLRDEAVAANQAHSRGQHEKAEWNIWEGFIEQLEAQRGKGMDAATANRFIAYARDLIALKR